MIDSTNFETIKKQCDNNNINDFTLDKLISNDDVIFYKYDNHIFISQKSGEVVYLYLFDKDAGFIYIGTIENDIVKIDNDSKK